MFQERVRIGRETGWRWCFDADRVDGTTPPGGIFAVGLASSAVRSVRSPRFPPEAPRLRPTSPTDRRPRESPRRDRRAPRRGNDSRLRPGCLDRARAGSRRPAVPLERAAGAVPRGRPALRPGHRLAAAAARRLPGRARAAGPRLGPTRPSEPGRAVRAPAARGRAPPPRHRRPANAVVRRSRGAAAAPPPALPPRPPVPLAGPQTSTCRRRAAVREATRRPRPGPTARSEPRSGGRAEREPHRREARRTARPGSGRTRSTRGASGTTATPPARRLDQAC